MEFKNERKDLKRLVSDPVDVLLTSGDNNKHCDFYPVGSYHKIQFDKDGNRWKTDAVHGITVDYPILIVDNFDEIETKECPSCKNIFKNDWPFYKETCIRCYEKKYLFDRELYREALRQELLKELNK